jgi:hypothetical protein
MRNGKRIATKSKSAPANKKQQMELEEMAEVSNPLESWFARSACLDPGAAPFLPDFLIISPPKTGSTWLVSNLGCHPGVFVPPIKEVKYFSTYYRWLDLNWYARHFQPGGNRLKGEASPSYSLLPCRMIRLIRTLMPEVKLIFLMRDPVGRAWSHARHNYRYREANFRACVGTIETVPDSEWRENFRHPWPFASGDYQGQLRRWFSVFPRPQIYVDLYERIQTDPVGLLSRIMDFLDVPTPTHWSSYRTRETILPGPTLAISEVLKHDLRLLLGNRTQALSAFLQEQFGLNVADQWAVTLGPGTNMTCGPERSLAVESLAGGSGPQVLSSAAMVGNKADDRPVARELENVSLELLVQENDYAAARVIEEHCHGYRIVLQRGRFLAVRLTLGEVDLEGMDEAAASVKGDILFADSLERAKEAVMHQVIRELRLELALSHSRQKEFQDQLRDIPGLVEGVRDSLESRQQELVRQLADCQAFVSRVRNSLMFRLRRRLARLFTRKADFTPKAD